MLSIFNGSIHVAQRIVILAQVLHDLPLAFFDRLLIVFRLLAATTEVAEDILDSIHPFIIDICISLRSCNSRSGSALCFSIAHKLLHLLNFMVMLIMDMIMHTFELLTWLSFAFLANDEASRLVSRSIRVLISLPVGT